MNISKVTHLVAEWVIKVSHKGAIKHYPLVRLLCSLWPIWIHRNNIYFNNWSPNPHTVIIHVNSLFNYCLAAREPRLILGRMKQTKPDIRSQTTPIPIKWHTLMVVEASKTRKRTIERRSNTIKRQKGRIKPNGCYCWTIEQRTTTFTNHQRSIT